MLIHCEFNDFAYDVVGSREVAHFSGMSSHTAVTRSQQHPYSSINKVPLLERVLIREIFEFT